MAQPFYHLRPGKYIDRYLFMQVLFHLHKLFDIETYQYVGFGSFLFDDFKILHNNLGLTKLISLESDFEIFERAQYNNPYKCIDVVYKKSTDFISEFNGGSSLICWLDYVSPSELGVQFSDFCSLITKMSPGDIIRITLNAHPASLGEQGKTAAEKQAFRFSKIKERIREYIPSSAGAADMALRKYPLFLLSCLEKAVHTTITPTKYDPRVLVPIFSTVYADGQQMVTLTAIMVDDLEKKREVLKHSLPFEYANFKWDAPSYLQVPSLTQKEMININRLLPHDCGEHYCTLDSCAFYKIKRKFPFAFKVSECKVDDIVKNYIDYYKYYPNFHHVSL